MGSGGSPTTSLMDQIGFERVQIGMRVGFWNSFRKLELDKKSGHKTQDKILALISLGFLSGF